MELEVVLEAKEMKGSEKKGEKDVRRREANQYSHTTQILVLTRLRLSRVTPNSPVGLRYLLDIFPFVVPVPLPSSF